MFLSISGHTSELSIASHSSRPTVSQLKCVSDTVSNWFENDKKLLTTVIYAPFNSFKTRIKWALSCLQPQVFWGYFFNSCNFRGNVKAFWLTGLLWWQKLTCFFQHFLLERLEGFAAHFCFCCKFSFHEKRRLSQVWQWHDFSQPITILCCK